MKDSRIIIMAAFRYALNRGSYVVGDVIDYIKENYHVLSDPQIASMIGEIRERYVIKHVVDITTGSSRTYHDMCLDAWSDLADWLTEKLNEKTSSVDDK